MNLIKVNTFLFLQLCAILLLIHVESKYTLKKVDIPKDQDIQVFTNDALKAYDGSDAEKPIYIGIKGIVFDVSSGRGYYGKGASYNALVGKDSSRAVAKMSLEPEDFTSDLTGLNDGTLEALDKVVDGTYLPKYPIVGYMDYLVLEQANELKNDRVDL